MQIDIAAHIERLLFEHETLIVPTFGGFTATRSAAGVDYVGGQVAPPSKTLAFNENLTVDDGILVHDISHAHNLPTDDARHLVLDFVEKTKDALSQREIVSLPGVGRLYKNYAQKIQFLPDTTNFNTESYGLPPLQFSPIARARDTAEGQPASTGNSAPANGPAPTSAPSPTPAGEEKTDLPQPATAPAAVSPAPPPPPAPPLYERTQQRNPMRSMAAFFVGLLVFATAVAIYMVKNKQPAAAKDAVVETRDQPTASLLPGPGAAIEEAKKATEQEAAAKKKAEPAPATEDDSKDDDTADEVEAAAAKKLEAAAKKEKAAKTDAAAEVEDAPETADGRRCVLVVGTYQKKENANKLLEKLRKGGYDTYYRMQKGHQVGIEFRYKDIREVQEKINAVQKLTGEDNIWIKRK